VAPHLPIIEGIQVVPVKLLILTHAEIEKFSVSFKLG